MEEKPRSIVIAVRVMWGLWFFGVLSFLAGIALGILSSSIPKASLLMMGFVYLPINVALWYLVRAVSQGKDWARIISALLAGTSIALILKSVITMPHQHLSFILLVIFMVFVVINAIILWLLFHKDSNAWFKGASL
jgi:hypothetical protein